MKIKLEQCDYFNILLISILLGCVIWLYGDKYEPSYGTNITINESLPVKYPFEYAMAETASIPYNEDPKYNCVGHTNDLVRRLNIMGYRAWEHGVQVNCSSEQFNNPTCYKSNGMHLITRLMIYIESTTGKVINPSDYKEYGIVRW